MKVLYITHLFWPNIGGIETLSINTLPLLKQKGYEFIIVTSTSHSAPESRGEYGGIPIYRYPMLSTFYNQDIRSLLSIRREISSLKHKYQPDLIHLHFGGIPINFFHSETTESHSIPILVTLHVSILSMSTEENTLLGKMLLGATWIVAVSDAVMKDAISAMPEIRKKISRIYNGVMHPNISPSHLVFNNPRLLCIGRMIYNKGFDLLLDAFKKIIKKHPRAQLIMAGDGPVRQDLEQKTTSFGLDRNVEYLGWIHPNDIPRLVNQSVAVIVPSRWEEPFGLVAVEAALMERPVIAARVGGLQEVVKANTTGILFEKENVNELSSAINYILSNPDMARNLGKTGRKDAEDRFSMERYIEQYDCLYKTLIKGGTNEAAAC